MCEFGSLSPEGVLLVVKSGSESWGVGVGTILPVSWVEGMDFFSWWAKVFLFGSFFSWWFLPDLSVGFLFLFFVIVLLLWLKRIVLSFRVWLLDWNSLGFGFLFLFGFF